MLMLAAFMLLAEPGQAVLVVQKEAIALEDLPTTLHEKDEKYGYNNVIVVKDDKGEKDETGEKGEKDEKDEKARPLAKLQEDKPARSGKQADWMTKTGDAKPAIKGTKAKNSQITVIVNMIQKVKDSSLADLRRAGKAYDEAACRCQDQMASAMQSMGENKEVLAMHRDLVKKYSAEIGSLKATTKQLAKDIKGLAAELKENEDTRATELPAFTKAKFNLDENIRSMGEAIKILGKPTAAKLSDHVYSAGSFLSIAFSTQDKLMSVVSQIKPMVTAGALPSNMQAEDVEVLKNFLAAPGKYVSGGTGTSALQVGTPGHFGNPSAQIDGIVKAMQDGFQADLATAVDDEANSIKAYESLKLVKSQEKFTFEQELQRSSGVLADTTKDMSSSKTLLDQTAKADASDKKFFETTTAACKESAQMWSVSRRMRTEEIAGLDRAMYELGSEYVSTGKAAEAVKKAVLAPPPSLAAFFIQLQETGMIKQQQRTNLQLQQGLMKMFSKLKTLALKSHSVNVALVALEAKASQSGVFDKLLPQIDGMIAVLRKEEQDDIKKRDYCENTLKDIRNDQSDLDIDIVQTNTAIGRINAKNKALDDYSTKITAHIGAIGRVINSEKLARKKEKALYLEEEADKKKAISMIGNAIVALENIYKNQFKLLQIQDKPQIQARFKPQIQAAEVATGMPLGKSASGNKDETNIVVNMMTMLVQDITNEVEEDKVDDAANQKTHNKKVAGLNEKIQAQQALRTNALKDKASGSAKKADLDAFNASNFQDKTTADTKKASVDAECAHLLVSKGFHVRRSNRKVEMQGLSDAKDVLAGGLPTL